MRRSIMVTSAIAATLAFAVVSDAHAQDEDDDEEVVVMRKRPKAEADGKVQVIVIKEGDDPPPRRRRSKPRKLEAIDGESPPPGYHTETTTMKGLWIAGISIWGAGYFLSILSGGIADAVEGHDEGRHTFYNLIPVAGPFITAAHREIEGPGKMPFILWGIMQAGGMGMFIGGLSAKKSVWVSDGASLSPELLIGPGSIGLRQRF